MNVAQYPKISGFSFCMAKKLLHLDEEYNLFEGVTRVADLCAAPGEIFGSILSAPCSQS